MQTEVEGVLARALPQQRPDELLVLKRRYEGLVLRATMSDGRRLVLKSGGSDYDPAMEAAMLRTLADGGLPVPAVDDVRDGVLVLAHCEGRMIAGEADWLAASDALRRLHGATRSSSFGLDYDTTFGVLRQPNGWSTNWASFFRRRRLHPLLRAGGNSGRLPRAEAQRIDACWQALGSTLDTAGSAALIHGDVWKDNVLMTKAGPLFLDPACFYADAEYERAFVLTYAPYGAKLTANWPRYGRGNALAAKARGIFYRLSFHLAHLVLFGRPSFLVAVQQMLSALESLVALPAPRSILSDGVSDEQANE